MTPSAPAPRPSEREIAERIVAQCYADWSDAVDKIEAALTEARRAAIEEAARVANIYVAQFPRGARRAIAAEEIAKAIRSLASPVPR